MVQLKFLLLFICLASAHAMSGDTQSGQPLREESTNKTCVLFGSKHAFGISAAQGWVMDNQSGRRQGLHMIFYPKGNTWANSPIMAYGRSVIKTDIQNIENQVARTLTDFKSNGSPDFKASRQSPITLKNGKYAEIYFYTGDQWGNYEAAAYFDEPESINFLIFNSHSEKDFIKNLPAFYEMVLTYKNFYTTATQQSNVTLSELEAEADKMTQTQKGSEYESRALNQVGQQLANTMRECASYFADEELQPFNYFVRIGNDGEILNEYLFPAQNSLGVCFKSYMANMTYPKHDLGSFLWQVNMKITP